MINVLHHEIERIRELLINNNYPITIIDGTIKDFLKIKLKDQNLNNKQTQVKLFFKNQFSNNYDLIEKRLKSIISRNTEPKNVNDKIQLITNCKTKTIKSLVIKNNPNNEALERRNNVVYQYTCPEPGCSTGNNSYIGYTTNTLQTRITQHQYNGAIRKHHEKFHNKRIQYDDIIQNLNILETNNKLDELLLLEALQIKRKSPILNKQDDGLKQTLKIF